MTTRRLLALAALVPVALLVTGIARAAVEPPGSPSQELFVDPAKGKDDARGDRRHPLRSLSAALARLEEPLLESVTVHLAAGTHDTTGGVGMPERTLELSLRMRPAARVSFLGPEEGAPAVLAWNGERRMIDVREGSWHFARVQVGAFSTSQRRGVTVHGPGRVLLEDVTFRLRSHSDVGILATDGGRATLRGAIRLNEHLQDEVEEETFCGILATDHGVVEFDGEDDASLHLGNGSLSVRYYGSIRLGCDEARVETWTKSNNLTVNNGGRIDLRNTPTTLRAHLENNTPIGLEHDGHVLAEDAKITIVGPNDSAIALQKASTFTCNDIDLVGDFEFSLWASSGSMFVGRFLGDVSKLRASTGASIHVEAAAGELVGPFEVRSGGMITLPDRVIRSD